MNLKTQGKPRNSTHTRAAILESATNLFSSKGYAGTSMSDLAENLGLSKAAIYHHFESKESILYNLMQSTTMDLKKLVKKNEALPSSKVDKREILKRFGEVLLANREVVRLVLSEISAEMRAEGPDGHAYVVRLHQLLAGRNPSAESKVRARIALGIIVSGIVPPQQESVSDKKEVNLELLVSIASDALGINS